MKPITGVKITDEALEAASKLSHRYIADRYLPDKAIDLIDEAAIYDKTQNSYSTSGIKRSGGRGLKLFKKKKMLQFAPKNLKKLQSSGIRKRKLKTK